MAMNNEQIRKAVAELAGYRDVKHQSLTDGYPTSDLAGTYEVLPGRYATQVRVPKYDENLSEVQHVAKKVLADEQWLGFMLRLAPVTKIDPNLGNKWTTARALLQASASHWCVALLKTVGKWADVGGPRT